jgi:hypothetical protein
MAAEEALRSVAERESRLVSRQVKAEEEKAGID